jgi:uncharacterized protein YndB with AHSA1/START domain
VEDTMVDVKVSTDINSPVHEVFEYVKDEANIPKWDEDLITATKTSPGETGVGSTFHLDIKPFMGVTSGVGKVVGFESDRLIELQWDFGKMKSHVFHIFEPSGSGTTFTRRIQIEPAGFMKLMAPMMGSRIKKMNHKYLATLKGLIESRS